MTVPSSQRSPETAPLGAAESAAEAPDDLSPEEIRHAKVEHAIIIQGILAEQQLARLQQQQMAEDARKAEEQARLEAESPAKKVLRAKLEDKTSTEKPSLVVFDAIKDYAKQIASKMPSPVSGGNTGYLYRYITQEPYKQESAVTPGFFQLDWQDKGIPIGHKSPGRIKKQWHKLRHIEEPKPESRFVWVADKKGEYKPASTDPAAKKYDMVRGWGIDMNGVLCVVDFDRVREVNLPVRLRPYDRGGDIRVGDPLETLRLYAKPMLKPGNDAEAFLSMYDYFTGQLASMYEAVNSRNT